MECGVCEFMNAVFTGKIDSLDWGFIPEEKGIQNPLFSMLTL
jgi:hypothetical protein